jgi:hypothetical protein
MKATSQYTVWLYDTACLIHMTGNRNLLTDLKPEQRKVNGIGPNSVYSTHIGKVVLEAILPGGKTECHQLYLVICFEDQIIRGAR